MGDRELHDPEEEQDTEETMEGGACEPEGCEEEPAGKDKGKKKQTKATTTNPAPAAPAKPAPATTPATRFMYPFNVRYAAEILDLTGFVDGQSYTEGQIKDLLIQNGFTEFADIEPSFHLSAATNTVVITIKGSKKGDGHGPEH